MNRTDNVFLHILDIFAHFLILNVMWLISCIPIVTIFPATTALFGVVRRWNSEGIEAGLFSLYVKEFKVNFKKSFILGLIWGIAGLVIFYDYYILLNVEFTGRIVLYSMLSFMTVLYLFTTVYVFFILVNFELRILHVMKNALFISISYFFHTTLCIAIIGTFLVILYFIPMFILLFGSILAFTLTQVFNRIFNKLQESKTAVK